MLKMRYLMLITFILMTLQIVAQKTETINSDNFIVEIQLPENWNFQLEGNRVKIKGPLPENIGINYIEKTSESLQSKYDEYVGALKLGTGFIVVEEGSKNINNLEYLYIEYEMKNKGILFHDRLFLTIHKNILYSIIITSTKDRYKSYLDILNDILYSIQFK